MRALSLGGDQGRYFGDDCMCGYLIRRFGLDGNLDVGVERIWTAMQQNVVIVM